MDNGNYKKIDNEKARKPKTIMIPSMTIKIKNKS